MMVNKTNLIKLANSSSMIKDHLVGFSYCVITAKSAEEYYNDRRKTKYDELITRHDVCRLTVANYEECAREIYNTLCS